MDSPTPPSRSRLWDGLLLTVGPGVLFTAYFTVPMGGFGPRHPALSWICFGLALGVLAALLAGQIRLIHAESEHGRPGVTILLVFCLSLVVFSSTYLALARQSGQFIGLNTRIDSLYFTVITMSTVGYGDIRPAGQEARVIVLLQILYTFVFLTAGANALTRRLRGQLAGRPARGRRRRPPGEEPPRGPPDGSHS